MLRLYLSFVIQFEGSLASLVNLSLLCSYRGKGIRIKTSLTQSLLRIVHNTMYNSSFIITHSALMTKLRQRITQLQKVLENNARVEF